MRGTQRLDFSTTHWSLIAAVSGPDRLIALERLYRIYWSPLCHYARRRGAVPEQEVEDVIQEFVVGLFESGSLGRAEPQRGLFRSYLLGALHHFLAHWREKRGALKRGGGEVPLSLDRVPESADPSDQATRQFDVEWAQALLAQGLSRLREETHGSALDALGMPGAQLERLVFSVEETPYADLARQWGLSVTGLKARVFRLRQRFRLILREEVARTVSGESEVEAELRYLCSVLGAQWN